MKLRLPKTNTGKLFSVLFSLTLLSAIPYFAGSGLDNPEPVGNFLNGSFPDRSAAGSPYRLAFPNLSFNSPLTFTPVPNSNILVVGQRNGRIYWFDNDNAVASKNLLADFSNEVGVVWDGGFLGLSIHPEFGTAGKNYFYMFYTTKDSRGRNYPDRVVSGFGCNREDYWGSFLVLKRIEVDPVTFNKVSNSDLVMMKMRMFSSTHRGGGITFGNDGYLYIPTGDQSAYAKSQITSTNLDGGVLRIDVDQDPSKSHAPIRKMPAGGRFSDEISGVGYGIPDDNPFLSPNGSRFEEYYSVGHRNPHRMTKDRETGALYIGEIGENAHEEINVIKSGKNYGWPIYEGNRNTGKNCINMLDGMPHEGPLVAFPRSQANALIGGYVYRGNSMPAYYGKYICADYGTGEEIWAVDTTTGQYDVITQFSPTNIISFGEDNSGELYLLSQGNNVKLYKLRQNGEFEGTVPELLSETGAFENLTTLAPNPGVIPYELIEPFWSDGAEKQRWMSIPNNGSHNSAAEQISFSEDGDWEFPVGSVLIKHFELPIDENNPAITKRLETRFSVKASSGTFYYLTYKWNDAQTDAVLLTSGLDEDVAVVKADGSTEFQTWNYPATQDCISCHNPVTKGTLGTRTRYLNSDYTYEKTGRTANQLVTLSTLGILDQAINDAATANFQTYKALDDATATLDEKARSYLDLNCAYCHRPGGTGDRAQFDLRLFNSLRETNLLTVDTNTPIGVEGEKIIEVGNPENSILYHRVNSVDPSIAMPPLAKGKIDDKGVALINEWITNLDVDETGAPQITEGIYTLESRVSGKPIEIAGGSLNNNANVQQWARDEGINQQFLIKKSRPYHFTIKAMHSGKYIGMANGGVVRGTNVVQYESNGTIAQEWKIEEADNGYYHIRSMVDANLFLDLHIASTADGANIKVWSNNGHPAQDWKLNLVAEGPCTDHIILETFNNIPGTAISTLKNNTKFPNNPDGVTNLFQFSIPANVAENYGARAKGRLRAPETGTYYFWVSGDDNVELNLSSDYSAENASRIAYHNAANTFLDWNRFPTQKSIGINLVAGQIYYLDAFLKEAAGGDHLSVGWRKPSDGNGTSPVEILSCDVFIDFYTPISAPVTAVAVSPETGTIIAGQQQQLTATITPADADDKTVVWSSSDVAIATVSAEGLVTAVSAGVATITVTTNDGNFTATSAITVEEEPSPVTVLTAPNPADYVLYVYFDSADPLTITALNIYDTDNALVKTFGDPVAVLDEEGNYVLAVRDIPIGTYTLEGVGTTGIYTKEITIARESANAVTVLTAPNPADYVLYAYFDSADPLTITVLNIYDTDNALIKTFSDPVGVLDAEGNYVLTVSDIPVGSYTLEGVGTTDNYTKEFIIERTVDTTVTVLTAPNPADNLLYVYFDSAAPLTITALNIYGSDNRVVKTFPNAAAVLAEDGNYVLTVSDISPGSYTLEGVGTTGNYTKQITIDRDVVAVTGLEITGIAPLVVGEQDILRVTVTPEDATDTKVVWSSGNPAIAAVDTNGVVEGVSVGEAVITARIADATATTTVTVSDVVMLIAPNPAIFEIYVYFQSAESVDVSVLVIYDAIGRQVKTFLEPLAVLEADGNYRLPIAELPAGRYIVEGVTTTGISYRKTVIVEN